MKTSFKLLTLLSLTALAAAPLLRAEQASPAPPAAPAGAHQRPPRGDRLKMLAEKLSLTEAQKTQIKPILEKAAQEGMALRDDAALSKEDKRDKMMAIRKTSHDQIRALLTPDQQKTFEAMPPPERGHRGPPHGDDAPPPKA
ncbi:MAG: protein refolding chaperone Spy/CpxP family [Verrucomicrobia bacterium]|nr:MAG: protein refolding chaperone Spy/CpxP family [Verrucomicrobiota bacterium]